MTLKKLILKIKKIADESKSKINSAIKESAQEILPDFKKRIFIEGKDEKNNSLGTYAKGSKKKGKINLTDTTLLKSSVKVNSVEDEVFIAVEPKEYKGKGGVNTQDVAQYQEERHGDSIFSLTKEEEQKFRRLVEDKLKLDK